ncbi:early nodulin-like protein 9 [Euphorbia lathyris]|uniref:early nodulin-like protein 9 n=1 Tax=Euphorbia lathyris TaxID=212925 RepID=UPI0033132D5B
MANISTSDYFLGLFSLMLLLQKGSATQFTVGGAKGWTVPENSSTYSYNQWAENTRFQIGDSLLFVYKADQDSVVEVNKQDYENCSTTAPVSPPLADGHSVFTFNRSGPHYFISGNKDNCLNNEKLSIIVLADRSNHSSATNATVSPSPPPSGDNGVLPSPSPAPAGEESPPSGTVEITPTPPPSSDQQHNGASSSSMFIISFTGFIGAFFASSLILPL